MIFIDAGNNTTKCQYCKADIIYNGDGGKRGYAIKKCKACGKKNGIAINMRCNVVSFKLEKEPKSE